MKDRPTWLPNMAAWHTLQRGNLMAIELVSVVHCPQCGAERAETMPAEYCQIRYTCPQCGTEWRPKQGDCCIFCSYGSMPCPSKQEERNAQS